MAKTGTKPNTVLTVAKAPTAEEPFLVVETGGKQYMVRPGEAVRIEKLRLAQADGSRKTPVEGEVVSFDKILLKSDGEQVELGAPFISGAKVGATVLEVGRLPKVVVMKYKQKSRYMKKNGHRQPFIKVAFDKF